MALSNKQIVLLHVLKKQNDLQDNEYRDLLEQSAGVSSADELDNQGFNQVLAFMEALGYEVNRPEPSPQFGSRPGMATPKQIDFIYGLSRKVFGGNNESAFHHWLEHMFRVSHPRFLDQATASKAIEGLKAMQKRGCEYSQKQQADEHSRYKPK